MDLSNITTQVNTMLEMQNDINCKINSEWALVGRPWYRCIWIECAELMDHAGYKWWKASEPEMSQVKLEIVDIWHFGLSILIENNVIPSDLLSTIRDHVHNGIYNSEIPKMSVLDCAERFAQSTLDHSQFQLFDFIDLMISAGMSFNELYTMYIGKNVLNTFRQDNGYKDGTYEKMWDGQEDNVLLVELSENLHTDHSDYPLELYKALQLRYNSCVG